MYRHPGNREEAIPGRGISECKGPEVGARRREVRLEGRDRKAWQGMESKG